MSGEFGSRVPNHVTFRVPFPPELTDRGHCPFDPPVRLGELSERAPVQQIDLLEEEVAWMVTGQDEARKVLTDSRFSADRRRNPAVVRRVPEDLREKLLDDTSLINMDPPEHTRYRRLLTGEFTVRRMRRLEPRILEIVTGRLDAKTRERVLG